MTHEVISASAVSISVYIIFWIKEYGFSFLPFSLYSTSKCNSVILAYINRSYNTVIMLQTFLLIEIPNVRIVNELRVVINRADRGYFSDSLCRKYSVLVLLMRIFHMLDPLKGLSQIARFKGPTWAHLGPVSPRWAPSWPHHYGPCYQGCVMKELDLQRTKFDELHTVINTFLDYVSRCSSLMI